MGKQLRKKKVKGNTPEKKAFNYSDTYKQLSNKRF